MPGSEDDDSDLEAQGWINSFLTNKDHLRKCMIVGNPMPSISGP